MGPHYRLLIRRERKIAQDHYLMYHENTAQLVYRVALVMHLMTDQSESVILTADQ